jgi:hypothetical protein
VWLPLTLYVVYGLRGGGPAAATACMVLYIAALAHRRSSWRFRSGAWRRIDLTGAREPALT